MMTMAPGMEGARWYHHQVESRYPPPHLPNHPHTHQHPGMHESTVLPSDHQVHF